MGFVQLVVAYALGWLFFELVIKGPGEEHRSRVRRSSMPVVHNKTSAARASQTPAWSAREMVL